VLGLCHCVRRDGVHHPDGGVGSAVTLLRVNAPLALLAWSRSPLLLSLCSL
jgi:hypothetical protein